MLSKRRQPAYRRILASAARANLADVLEAVGEGKERILIDRRGKPPVALVSVDDLLQLEMIEAREKSVSPRTKPKRASSRVTS